MRKIKKIHIHHSAVPDLADWSRVGSDQIFNSIKNYHIHHKGWVDVGYHDIIMPNGVRYYGRSIGLNPASIKWHNTGAYAICFIGNFEHDEVADCQLYRAFQIIKDLVREYNIPLNHKTIVYHREKGNTLCPGKNFPNKDKFLEILNRDIYITS